MNPPSKATLNAGKLGGNLRFSDSAEWYDHLKSTDPIGGISANNSNDEILPDAVSEKELGNEYFKKKRFRDAIECYSRSIALCPTSVAFANRAMSFLKMKRYEEAENDCTEALTLDDRYVKAYSRRATARKELRKLKSSLEDADFAVRLEPNNQELRKQYSEIKAMYEKEFVEMKPGSSKPIVQDSQRKESLEIKSKEVKNDYLVSSKAHKEATSAQKSGIVKNEGVQQRNELKASLQEVASRAASRAMALTANNLTAPKSAYEFEVSWRALSNDSALQAQLLKMIPPPTLPQIFKNALSAPILVDIIKCIATFTKEDSELAVSILDNMTRIPRFDMIIMCLSAKDQYEIKQLWEEIFSTRAIPAAHMEALAKLRSKYCLDTLMDDTTTHPLFTVTMEAVAAEISAADTPMLPSSLPHPADDTLMDDTATHPDDMQVLEDSDEVSDADDSDSDFLWSPPSPHDLSDDAILDYPRNEIPQAIVDRIKQELEARADAVGLPREAPAPSIWAKKPSRSRRSHG